MASKKIKIPQNLRNTQAFKKMKLKRSVKQIDKKGRFTNKATLRKRASIQQAIDILEDQGIMIGNDTIRTTQRMSEEMIFALGYTVENDGPDFTLVDTQTPNLQEKDMGVGKLIAKEYSPIKNFQISTMSMVDSFPNHFNPIYILDEQEPRDLQRTREAPYSNEDYRHLDLVDTACRCASMGIMNTKIIKSIKYFDNNQVAIALIKTNNRT